MLKRHALSDEQWEMVEPLLPRRTATTGRPPSDPRLMLDGVLWILRTGAPWRDLPERFGPHQTVYDHFRNWRKDGTYDRVLQALHIRLDREGKLDWSLWCVDGSSVRASRAAAGAAKKALRRTHGSRTTTPWAAAAADSGAKSTWWWTAAACR